MATQAELELVFRLRDQVTQNLGRVQSAMRALDGTVKQLARSIGTPGSLAAGGLIGSALAIGFSFDSTAEQATIAFTTIFKSSQRAEAMVERLKQTAIETPFAFTDILRSGQRLAAAGFGEDEIASKMMTISDAISSTGDISRDKLDQITLAVARARSAGVFDMGMIESFSAAGINVVGALAAQEGIPEFAMSKRLSALSGRVAAGPMVDQIFKALDARFRGLSATQASSMQGVVNNIRDITQQLLGAVLLPLFTRTRDVLRFIAYWLQQIRDWFKTLSQPVQDMVKFWGSWVLWAAAAVVVLGALVTVLTPVAAGIMAVVGALEFIAGILVLIDPVFVLIAIALYVLYLAWVNNWFGIRDKLTAVWNAIAPILAGVWDWLVKIAGQAWTFAVNLAGTAWDWIVWLAGQVGKGATIAWDTTINLLGAGWDWVVWLAQQIGNAAVVAWDSLVYLLGEGWDWLKWLAIQIYAASQLAWDSTINLLGAGWEWVQWLGGQFARPLAALWSAEIALLGWAWDTIKWLQDAINKTFGLSLNIDIRWSSDLVKKVLGWMAGGGTGGFSFGDIFGSNAPSPIPAPGGGTSNVQSVAVHFNGPVYANDIEDMVVKALDTATRKGRTV